MKKRKRVSWNQQIVTIENKGYQAFLDGKPETDNPYQTGHCNQNGIGGQFQRQRSHAWARGFGIARMESLEQKAKTHDGND